MTPVEITYFSDVLCIWAYASQARIDAVQKKYGNAIRIHYRFCSVFGDTEGKIASSWMERDGYAGFNAHLQDVAKRFPHVDVHRELWMKARPLTSSSVHLFMKAVERCHADGPEGSRQASISNFVALLQAFRTAFFRDCHDIARWGVQCDISKPFGVNIAAIEQCIHSGAAFAMLAADYQDADKMRIEGSPSFVLNEGRQKLYGNVGFHLIEAFARRVPTKPVGAELRHRAKTSSCKLQHCHKGNPMYYIVESAKSVDEAAQDLEAAVKRHRFGVLHVHNLQQTLKSKGIDFANECRIFEVCNPAQAVNVLNQDMTLNMALPCRISVYQEGGKTKIGMIRPKALLGILSSDPKLEAVAEEVESATIKMIDEAK